MTPEALQQRINAHKRELFADIPALTTLRSSRIEWRHELLNTGLSLGFYLQETSQMAIQLPADESERSILTDLFLQEVTLVASQQKAIRQRISRAMSPAVDPSEDNDVLKIRKRLKSTLRDEGFLIPNGPEPERLLCENLPKVLPRGYELEVRVRVNWLNPKKAEVRVREVVNLEGNDTIGLLPNTKINLFRLGAHRRPESGRRLQEAMDTKRELTLQVTVALNWITGEPLYLELVAFVSEKGNKTGSDRGI